MIRGTSYSGHPSVKLMILTIFTFFSFLREIAMLAIWLSSIGAIIGAFIVLFGLRRNELAAQGFEKNSKVVRSNIKKNLRFWSWTVVGGLGGAFGAQLFMLPLNYCTFDEGRDMIEVYMGYGLIVLGIGLLAFPLQWLALHGWTGLSANQKTQGIFHNPYLPWLLLLPTLIILVLFLYYPFMDTFRLSTLLASRTRTAFVCLKNFADISADPDYLAAVGRTFVFAISILVGGLSAGLGIAMLAYQPINGANIYRVLLVWPHAISPVVAGVIFRLMFNPTGGVINYFTKSLFGITFDWLNDPFLASITVILASIWTLLGFNILFFLAGLQTIPKDLLESAAIDGANAWQRFYSILLPLLSPIFFFLLITNITFSFFDIFGTIDYLTSGGPLESTTVMIYNVFETQRDSLGLGKAAAQSVILFFLVVAITYIQFRTSEKQVNYGA
jgi:sn-glycerol 3-phosphate transport system permease protein